MKENNSRFKKSIEGLSQIKAPDIWESIHSELDRQQEENKDNLDKAVESLKIHKAPNIWLSVAAQIDSSRSINWEQWLVAASIILALFIGVYFIVQSSESTGEQLSYSTEQVEFFDVAMETFPIEIEADDMVLTYIKQNCTRLVITCQDPEFKALLEAYVELNETKEELKEAIEKTTNRPQIMKYLIKVEKDQAAIGKNMLKKMKSI